MKFLFGIFLISLVFSQQTQPIPSSPDGYAYGPVSTNYTLDVFFDHVCVDSATAYPALNTFWTTNQDWLRMVVHIFPLSFHYYAFYVGRAGRFIQDNYPDTFTNFLSWMFLHYSTYTETAQAWDLPTLYANLAADTQTATGVPAVLVQAALNNSTFDYELRTSWKYATSHAITGTPQYILNGIWVPAAAEFTTVQQWQDFCSSLS